MKKLYLIVAFCLLICLSACNRNPNYLGNTSIASTTTTTITTSNDFTSPIESTNPSSDSQSSHEVEEEIKKLVDNNLYCLFSIFYFDRLPLLKGSVINNNYVVVNSERFPKFNDLKVYVESIYTKQGADELLYNFNKSGKPIYLEIDGKFVTDMTLWGDSGYPIKWDNYTLSIDKYDESICTFTLGYLLGNGADEYFPKSTTMQAVKEDDKWKLKELFAYVGDPNFIPNFETD